MGIMINVLEWIAYIAIIIIAIWSADKTLLLMKKWYEWRIRKIKNRKDK